MTGIVERLRALGREYWQHKRYYDEAAAEIERLRGMIAFVDAADAAENNGLRAEIRRVSLGAERAMLKLAQAEQEIEQLKAEAGRGEHLPNTPVVPK